MLFHSSFVATFAAGRGCPSPHEHRVLSRSDHDAPKAAERPASAYKTTIRVKQHQRANREAAPCHSRRLAANARASTRWPVGRALTPASPLNRLCARYVWLEMEWRAEGQVWTSRQDYRKDEVRLALLLFVQLERVSRVMLTLARAACARLFATR